MLKEKTLNNQLFKIKKYRNKYGDSFIKDIDSLENDYKIKLQTLATRYNITRETVRLAFNIIKGYPYTIPYNNLKKEYNFNKNISTLQDPRLKTKSYKKNNSVYSGASAELKVWDICNSLGFTTRPCKSLNFDFYVNDKRIDVKSRKTFRLCSKYSKTHHYTFGIKHNQIQENYDFIICYIIPLDKFYIIPKFELDKKGISIAIRHENKHYHPTGAYKNNWYDKYLEAWQLLL